MDFREAVAEMKKGKFLAYGDHEDNGVHYWYTWKDSWMGLGGSTHSGDSDGFIIMGNDDTTTIKRFGNACIAHSITLKEALATDWFVIEDVDAFVNRETTWEQQAREKARQKEAAKAAEEERTLGLDLFQ